MATFTNRPLFATAHDAGFFMGDDPFVDRLLAAVHADYNVVVFGGKGSGKSSLLHYVEYRLRDERRVVYIDGSVAPDAETFLRLVRFHLGSAPSPAETVKTSAQAIFRPQRPRAELGELLEVLDDLRAASREEDHDEHPLTLIVDDLDARIAHTVFGRLRNEIWGFPYRWLVGASEESRAAFLTPPADGFFEVVMTLEPMTDDVLASLLVRRADGALTHKAALELAEYADGNPRRAINLARSALLNGGGAKEIVAMQADIAVRLERVSGAAKMVYQELEARGQASASDAEMLDRFRWSRQRASRVFAELEAAGLVVAQQENRESPGRPRKIYMPALGPAT